MAADVLSLPNANVPGTNQLKVSIRENPSDKLGLSSSFVLNGIYQSICEQNSKQSLACIKQGENVNVTCSLTGNTLLHIIMVEASPITETRYVPIVYQLSNAGILFDIANKQNITALQLSVKMHLLELMIALIKCGATCNKEEDEELIVSCSGPVEYEFRSAYRKFAPGYWIPVQEDKAHKVNVLVKSWCRININRNGKSVIEYAKECGCQEKIIKMLIDNEVNIEFAHAVIAGDLEKMQSLLLHYKVDIETKDFSHKENFFEPYCPLTLYGAALRYGHRHIVHLIKHSDQVIREEAQRAQQNQKQESELFETNSSAVCLIL